MRALPPAWGHVAAVEGRCCRPALRTRRAARPTAALYLLQCLRALHAGGGWGLRRCRGLAAAKSATRRRGRRSAPPRAPLVIARCARALAGSQGRAAPGLLYRQPYRPDCACNWCRGTDRHRWSCRRSRVPCLLHNQHPLLPRDQALRLHPSHDPVRDAAPCQISPGCGSSKMGSSTGQARGTHCKASSAAVAALHQLRWSVRRHTVAAGTELLSRSEPLTSAITGPLPPSLLVSEAESQAAGSTPCTPLLPLPLPRQTRPRSPRAAELGPMLEAHARWPVGLLEGRQRVRAHHRSASAADDAADESTKLERRARPRLPD